MSASGKPGDASVPGSWPPSDSPSGPKPALTSLVSTHDFEQVASQTFPPKTWAFISSAATDLLTKQRNSAAYSLISLRPRVLRNVAEVDTSTRMMGHAIRAPIFCSPAAMAKFVHEEGEKDAGRACKESGLAQCLSNNSSLPVQDVVTAIDGYTVEKPFQVPVFFQLYVDRDRWKTVQVLEEAIKAGVKALFLTVDAPLPGKREADERIKADESVSSPISGAKAKNDAKGGSFGRLLGSYIDASVTWDDIPWLRSCAPGIPIVLKGIQTSEDAVLAMKARVDGIVVSNHGGRSVDTAGASILALMELNARCPEVFDVMEVYVDGGIKRGTDIFKALCLGARAVGVGRGWLYALNYGKAGVCHYMESKLSFF